MALYREGKAAMAEDGTVTGNGTKWQSSLSLIRPGATIMFFSSPIQMAVVNKVVSDTEIKAITTNGAVVASTDYAILLSDSLTVDGLAQDVAETLRYYQSQETVIADAVEFFKDFDFESLQNLANQIKADSEAAESSATAAAASENAAKTSEANAKSSENAAKNSEVAAENARDQVQQIINDAGEQSTLVALAQPDGFKNVGRCHDVATLRTIEPTYAGQTIILERYSSSCPTLNAAITHDPDDTTSPDDDCSVWVTPNGARWKADISKGYNVALAGLNKQLTNLPTAFNKVRDAIINRIVAQGRVNNVHRKIIVPNIYFVNVFKVTEPLIWPSIIAVVFEGSAFIEAESQTTFDPVQAGRNDYFSDKLTLAMFRAETGWKNNGVVGPLNQATSRYILDCHGGEIDIRGPGYALDTDGNPTISTSGITFGNLVACNLDCRDAAIRNVNVIGFRNALKWGTYNTFMCGLRDCNLSRCYDGLVTPTPLSNSGERMWLDNVTVGNMANDAFVGNSSGKYTLTNCSIDFIGRDAFHCGPKSSVCYEMLSGHIEGIGRYVAAKDTPADYSRARVHVSKHVEMDTRDASDYRGIRQLFSCPNSSYGAGLYVEFDASIIGFENVAPKAEYPTFGGSPSNTGLDLRMRMPRVPGSRYPNTYSYGSKLINITIQPAEGSTGEILSSNPLTTGNLFAAIKTGNASASYGELSDQNDDTRVIKITLTAATESVQLFVANRAKAASGRNPLWASCSVKTAGATGRVNLTPIMANYLGSTVNVNSATIPTTYSVVPSLAATTMGFAVDMLAQRVAAGLPSTQEWQAVQSPNVLPYWQGADLFVPGWLITGFVGTIYLKGFAFWFDTENGGY